MGFLGAVHQRPATQKPTPEGKSTSDLPDLLRCFTDRRKDRGKVVATSEHGGETSRVDNGIAVIAENRCFDVVAVSRTAGLNGAQFGQNIPR